MPASVLDLVWPRSCEVCGRPCDRPRRHVCSDCLNRLPLVPTVGCCRRCGRDACGLDANFLCEDCREFRPSFDRAASAMRMDGEARRMVNSFKYHAHFWLRDDLVDLMEATVRARFPVEEIDVVLSMPSTARHLWLRGYNPARELAKPLARRLGRPAPAFVVRRKGMPRRQAGLSEDERRANAVGTFAVTRPGAVAGRTALVVDDVMTTGSTLSACAAELKRAGAVRVWCASAVRSLRSR